MTAEFPLKLSKFDLYLSTCKSDITRTKVESDLWCMISVFHFTILKIIVSKGLSCLHDVTSSRERTPEYTKALFYTRLIYTFSYEFIWAFFLVEISVFIMTFWFTPTLSGMQLGCKKGLNKIREKEPDWLQSFLGDCGKDISYKKNKTRLNRVGRVFCHDCCVQTDSAPAKSLVQWVPGVS